MALLIQAPGLQQRALPLSVKAWHTMIAQGLAPKRAELIRGAIIEKMSKSMLHVQLVNSLHEYLNERLSASHWIRKEDPLTFRDSEPEPDISVVSGERADYRTAHPTTAKLVIEVAVSTLTEDREMAGIYAEALVDEFWIINAAERNVEIRRQPVEGCYQMTEVVPDGEIARCSALPGIEVDVAALFAGATA